MFWIANIDSKWKIRLKRSNRLKWIVEKGLSHLPINKVKANWHFVWMYLCVMFTITIRTLRCDISETILSAQIQWFICHSYYGVFNQAHEIHAPSHPNATAVHLKLCQTQIHVFIFIIIFCDCENTYDCQSKNIHLEDVRINWNQNCCSYVFLCYLVVFTL